MSEKPVYKVLDKLINSEWHTEEELFAEDGETMFNGFYGTYDVEVEKDGIKSVQKINFTKNGNKKFTFTL